MKRWLVVVMLVLAAAAWGQDFERFEVTVDDCEPFVIEMRPGGIDTRYPPGTTYAFVDLATASEVRISQLYEYVSVRIGRLEYHLDPADPSSYFNYWKKIILEARVRAFWPPYRETKIKISRVIE